MRKNLIITILLATALSVAAEIPDGYYSSLNGKNKGALKTAAKNVVRKHTVVEYGTPTWEAFEKTDVKTVDGIDYWWDMYSNNLVKISSGHGGLNIEHAVPNSWWGKTKNDAYKDLFHLNPSDAEANNRKSFYPLGIVASVTYDNGVTKVGHPASGDCYGSSWAYEPPDYYKGDFARAYFYMYTVYDDLAWQYDASDRNYMFDGSTYPTLRPWAYEMLLEWNRMDPVDKKEKDRNEAIYSIQGNRNPFIDLPELAEYIWGSKTSQSFDSGSTGSGGDDPVNPPTPGGSGSGTESDPYDVEYVLSSTAETNNVWVVGYIVGYIEGFIYESGINFSNDTEDANYTNTNCLMAGDIECNDASKCIPLQLPKGEMREALGLGNNPDIYLKKVMVKGDLSTYFNHKGVKNVSEYKLVTTGAISLEDTYTQKTLTAYNIDGGVGIIAPEGAYVNISDLSGRIITTFRADSHDEYVALPAGFYVVYSGVDAKKIIIR